MSELPDSYEELPMEQQRELARGVDFLPPLSFQAALRGDVEIYYFDGHVTKSDVQDSKVTETSLGGEIEFSTQSSNRVDVTYGTPYPFDRGGASFDTISISEAYEDIHDIVEVPDITTTELGIMHKAPDDVGALNGAEKIAELQVSRGSRSPQLERQTGWVTMNHTEHRKETLLNYDIIDSDETSELTKRAKSTLVSKHLLTDTGKDHSNFASEDLVSMFIEFQQGQLLQDIAVPVDAVIDDVKHEQSGRLYRLMKAADVTAL